MAKNGRMRARARGRKRTISPAERAAIRHVRWFVTRCMALGRGPAGLRARARARARAKKENPGRIAAGASSLQPLSADRSSLQSGLRRALVLSRRYAGHMAARLLVLLGIVLRAASRGVAGFLAVLMQRRVLVIGGVQRLLWWVALVLFVVGGRDLLSPYEGTLVEALPYFIVGFSLCALAILLASSRRIRWAALALGFGHGALGLLLWTVLQSQSQG